MLAPLLFATFLGLVFWGLVRDDPDVLPSQLVGLTAPMIEARPLGDYPSFDSSVFADGQVKLVNFWASWCAPCRAEHPNLIELSKQIPVYGVNKQDDPEKALKFLAEVGNPFTAITTDDKGRQSIDWGVYGLPESFLLDGDGNIILRYVGAITRRRINSQLGPAITAALADSQS